MNNIICIGRQYGSGGREIGEKLSEMLGIPCYDKMLIKKASLESGLNEDFISKKEESPINRIQFLSGNPYADIAGICNTFYSDTARGNPESYDMMLSSSKFGTDGCAKIIVNTIRKMEESENE